VAYHRRRGHAEQMKRKEKVDLAKADFSRDLKVDSDRLGPWGAKAKQGKFDMQEMFCGNDETALSKSGHSIHLPGVLKPVLDAEDRWKSVDSTWTFGTCAVYNLELCYDTCGTNLGACAGVFKMCMEDICAQQLNTLSDTELENCLKAARRHSDDTIIYGRSAWMTAQTNACRCVHDKGGEVEISMEKRHHLKTFMRQWKPDDTAMVERLIPIAMSKMKYPMLVIKLHTEHRTLMPDGGERLSWKTKPSTGPEEPKLTERDHKEMKVKAIHANKGVLEKIQNMGMMNLSPEQKAEDERELKKMEKDLHGDRKTFSVQEKEIDAKFQEFKEDALEEESQGKELEATEEEMEAEHQQSQPDPPVIIKDPNSDSENFEKWNLIRKQPQKTKKLKTVAKVMDSNIGAQVSDQAFDEWNQERKEKRVPKSKTKADDQTTQSADTVAEPNLPVEESVQLPIWDEL